MQCSVNKLVPSSTKWTQACDKRLARLLSYIHYTRDYRQCCHAGNAAQHCRLDLFKTQTFGGDFEDSKINIRRNLMYIRMSYICFFLLDVLEADIIISQFHRIGNYFIGCWIANGWITCPRFVGCGDRCVAFDKQRQNTD